MEILVDRKWGKGTYTISDLYMDGGVLLLIKVLIVDIHLQ